MIYKVIIEKLSENNYIAFCPYTHSLRAWGRNVSSALENLQKGFSCYLHDPCAELEIMINWKNTNHITKKISHYKKAFAEGRIFLPAKE